MELIGMLVLYLLWRAWKALAEWDTGVDVKDYF